ncbi:hypothetical protein LIA77_09014 [Sarocladium implicatum]|nr:hypothetical protein LIA77_09014 [Sarocladium implicatum]
MRRPHFLAPSHPNVCLCALTRAKLGKRFRADQVGEELARVRARPISRRNYLRSERLSVQLETWPTLLLRDYPRQSKACHFLETGMVVRIQYAYNAGRQRPEEMSSPRERVMHTRSRIGEPKCRECCRM